MAVGVGRAATVAVKVEKDIMVSVIVGEPPLRPKRGRLRRCVGCHPQEASHAARCGEPGMGAPPPPVRPWRMPPPPCKSRAEEGEISENERDLVDPRTQREQMCGEEVARARGGRRGI